MAGQRGYKGKVSLSTTKVVGIGKWEYSGITNQVLDSTELEDEFDSKEYGRGNGGTVTFSGFYDPDDSTGQAVIRAACIAKTAVDTIRFYFGAGESDYFKLDASASALVTNVSGPSADKDASGLCPISFTVEISGGTLEKAA